MTRQARSIVAAGVILLTTLLPALAARTGAQLDDKGLDTAIAASVQISVGVSVETYATFTDSVPLGSGTVVSPNGLILTAWHVVDPVNYGQAVGEMRAYVEETYGGAVEMLDNPIRIGTTDGVRDPEVRYSAHIVGKDADLDLAVLQIDGDADGKPIDPASFNLPYLRLGASSDLGIADRVDILGFPAVGGGRFKYTSGLVSGFWYNDDLQRVSYVFTDAISSGGSSGGTVIDAAGKLVGVLVASPPLDCEPADTNDNGIKDDGDGCIPHGGTFSIFRPIDLAKPLLTQAVSKTSTTSHGAAATASLPATNAAGTATPRPSAAGPSPEAWIQMRDTFFFPSSVTVTGGQTVTLHLTNNGKVPHSFDSVKLGISVTLQPGERRDVTFDGRPGTFPFYCNLDGHRDAGMVGTLNVVAPRSSPTPAPAAKPTESATATITTHDISFQPNALSVPADTDVALTLTNQGAAPHNFSLDALGISVDLRPGQSRTITLNAPAGQYAFSCDVPGHKEAGMVGSLTAG